MPHAGGARGYGAMRRDGDIAPYRHAARVVRTRITHGALPGAMPHAGCAPDPPPKKKIFVLLYIPLKSSLCPFVLKIHTCNIRTTTGHAHCPWRLATPDGASREVRRPMGATNR